ncbi:histidine kinase [Bosea thiooxidans]|uniref:histidine kinase n=1 Tax=Bosea thiooxidans TaxID=53254 RepID=A0A0Q3LZZ5_9HYPH|nr:sensor histidine kinase N-terminal domain-containing protein [Bosea thiooxidans]KQK29033.1 histidine kinase [Bosea thiooxidans]SKB76843.1 two-component system, OmpR family, sensor histidine kinase QseC [Bosea thiooxidans]
MTSLRARLFVILVAATSAIWLVATGWIYLGTKRELEHVLDTRLQEAARMVASLVRDDGGSAQAAIAASPSTGGDGAGYERQLSCQIWSLGGRLVAASTEAPAERLTERGTGFSDSVINGEPWRVYAIEDPAKGVRVLVGDRLGLRERLVQDLVLGLVAPAVLMLPFFAWLIWLSVGRGLAPLKQIASDLKRRAADDLRPVQARVADEIRPVMEALNGLFRRLEAARRHEREITAFAAHELRTPLAGIRTQAQIAKAADDREMRLSALDRIIEGVDRTARLVSQLLALARLDSGAGRQVREPVNLGQLLREIERERTRGDQAVEIDPALDRLVVEGDPDRLRLALRNLHENACGQSPPRGLVRWGLAGQGGIAVEDEGPGIPPDEIPLVTQRFYRGRGTKVAGSGLGLAIVEAALAGSGGALAFAKPTSGQGLRAEIAFREARSIPEQGPA